MAENTTGKDRKNLAKWVFTAASVHPDLKNILVVSTESRDTASRETAALFTKLFSESCAVEAKVTIKNEGSSGMEAAGKILGELAMQELLSNQDVAASLVNFTKYIDNKKIEKALKSD